MYDVVTLGGLETDEKTLLSGDVAEKLVTSLKASGRLIVHKNAKDDCTAQNLVSTLKLSGFVNVNETKDTIMAAKPDYAIGSSVKLNFSSNSTAPAKVWTLADDEDGELINEDELLDEEDLKKPDPASLKVCGTTGKRKACANCSCGLAEELEQEAIDKVKQNTQNAKSSCGSVS